MLHDQGSIPTSVWDRARRASCLEMADVSWFRRRLIRMLGRFGSDIVYLTTEKE